MLAQNDGSLVTSMAPLQTHIRGYVLPVATRFGIHRPVANQSFCRQIGSLGKKMYGCCSWFTQHFERHLLLFGNCIQKLKHVPMCRQLIHHETGSERCVFLCSYWKTCFVVSLTCKLRMAHTHTNKTNRQEHIFSIPPCKHLTITGFVFQSKCTKTLQHYNMFQLKHPGG